MAVAYNDNSRVRSFSPISDFFTALTHFAIEARRPLDGVE